MLKDVIRNIRSQEGALVDELDHWLMTGCQEEPDAETVARRARYLHPSAMGRCSRAVVYEKIGVSSGRSVSAQLQRVFDNGHSFHRRMQRYYGAMGVLHGTWACDACGKRCRVHGAQPGCPERAAPAWEYLEPRFRDEEERISGRCDGIVFHGGRRLVLEFKSINNRGFVSLSGPRHDHMAQGQLYAHEFRADGVVYQYENKDTQAIREYVMPRDDMQILLLLEKARDIWKCILTATLPARVCPSVADAYRCDYKDVCFNEFFDPAPYFESWRERYGAEL